MKYSLEEIMQYVKEEDVQFIRLAFCDVFGKQKNISIIPAELSRAFEYGIAIDGSAIAGFGDTIHSDLLLHPDVDTMVSLPWRPEHGKVVRMFTGITYPDGRPFECDTRSLLKQAVSDALEAGYQFSFGAKQEFYLFKLDDVGEPTKEPYDRAGYMDLAPEDRGENIRREICLILKQMGIQPETSHHEEGPGQNEIDISDSDPVCAADNALTFQTVARTVAYRNGLYADFGPKPLADYPGNGLHINISVRASDQSDPLTEMAAGVLDKINDMCFFLNPIEASYHRYGSSKAPVYISWSSQNRSQLMRIPAAIGAYQRAELRSPDPMANPYLALTLIIYAGLYGIQNNMQLPPAADMNLFKTDEITRSSFKRLPQNLSIARSIAANSDFIRSHISEEILKIYCGR